VPTVEIVRHVRVEVARRASAWWSALAMTAAMLVAWPAVSPSPVQAAGVCGAQSACLVLADGLGEPAMWEEGTTRLMLVVDPPPSKPAEVQLVYGPADGKDGRVDRYHRLEDGESGIVWGVLGNISVPENGMRSISLETFKGDNQ